MKILLLPLDARPANTEIPRALAAIAGHEVILPPPALLGRGMHAADTRGLLEFLIDHAPLADLIVASVDLMVHGGIETSRDGALSLEQARLRFLQFSAALRPHAARTTLFSYITRNTISSSSDSVAPLARLIAKLNTLRQRGATSGKEAADRESLLAAIPRNILESYDFARKRNHQIQLLAADLIKKQGAARIVYIYDRTGEDGPVASEDRELHEFTKNQNVQFMNGSDEAGAALIASAILDEDAPVIKLGVLLSDAPGMGRRALYEFAPFRETFHANLRPLGIVIDHGEPEIELYLHPPAPNTTDLFQDPSPRPRLDVSQFVDLLKQAVLARRPVVLADCGHCNGADPNLLQLIPGETLMGLSGFAARGTGSTTLSTALAHAAMIAAGKRNGNFNEDESVKFLQARLLDDYLYQTIVRPELGRRCEAERVDRYQMGAHADEMNELLDARLHELLTEKLAFGVRPFRAEFPWSGLGEIEIHWLEQRDR